jgi:hypothetical protein
LPFVAFTFNLFNARAPLVGLSTGVHQIVVIGSSQVFHLRLVACLALG